MKKTLLVLPLLLVVLAGCTTPKEDPTPVDTGSAFPSVDQAQEEEISQAELERRIRKAAHEAVTEAVREHEKENK